MPDVCDLVLEEHDVLRRRFADLDELRAAGAGADQLGGAWGPLAELLELHAATEEAVFYPDLVRRGRRGDDETLDAIKDHNEIRDAVRAAAGQDPGSDAWWDAVGSAREANSDHMAEEEREALPDMRTSVDPADRSGLGAEWEHYRQEHPRAEDADRADKDPQTYVSEQS